MENQQISSEKLQQIDILILQFLRDSLELGNVGYSNIRPFFVIQKIQYPDIESPLFDRRVFYNIGLSHIELRHDIDTGEALLSRCEKDGIDPATLFVQKEGYNERALDRVTYLHNFLDIKITVAGLLFLEKMLREEEQSKTFFAKWNRLKWFFEFLGDVKKWGSTGLAMLLIIFGINSKSFLENIPVLSSIINTEISNSFSPVDQNDEYFQSLRENIKVQKHFIQIKTSDISVMPITSTKKIFRLILPDNSVLFYEVEKSMTNFRIKEGHNSTQFNNPVPLPINTDSYNTRTTEKIGLNSWNFL